MDKQRIDPIVADRDDMIGRSPSLKNDAAKTRDATKAESSGISPVWKIVILIAFCGCISITWFGWQQYQKFLVLQERFELLSSRLNNTDESVSQSGAAMQINISKQSEQLKKHWSEIRKLWGVANDKNKSNIQKNSKDIAFLATKRSEFEASLKKLRTAMDEDSKRIETVGENYFGLSADMEQVNESLANYLNALNTVDASLKSQQAQLQNNIEAINSMDGFRRLVNQKLLDLERQMAKKPIEQEVQTIEPVETPQPLPN